LTEPAVPAGFWRYIPNGITGKNSFSIFPYVMAFGDADFYLAKDMLTFSGLIHLRAG
jgi:hypothetical protein